MAPRPITDSDDGRTIVFPFEEVGSARIVPRYRLILNGTRARLGLTAQSGESEEKALDLGAHDYLTEPVHTRWLAAPVRAVLERINT